MVRFQKILCPVDFFKTSTRAFEYALRLAENYGAKVHALHVVAPVIPSAYGAPFSAQDLTADLEKESKRLMQQLKTRAGRVSVPVTTEVTLGDVDVEILRAIKKQKADLLVMGTHGRRGFERLVMGSETERMVRHSPIPVMTIGPGRRTGAVPPNIRRILLTTDFSDGTADAVAYALSIAQECEAKLTLLHVVNDVAADVSGKYREPLLRGIEEQLQKLIPESALDWCSVETQVDVGLPFKIISETIESGKFDLLVMNIHGKNLLDRALIGSTAERALRAASDVCPVLLIPPAPKKARKKRQPQRKP